MLTSKKILIFLSLIILVFTPACGSKPIEAPSKTIIPSPTSKPTPTKKTKIKIAVPKSDGNLLSGLVEEYNKNNLDTLVQLLEYPTYEYKDKLMQRLSEGEPIDLFAVNDIIEYVELIEKKYSLSLDSFVKRDTSSMQLELYGDTLNDMKKNSELFGLPFTKTAYVLFYNKKLFDEVKVPYPKAMTWAEFQVLSKKMTRTRNKVKVYGSYFDTRPQAMFIPLIQKNLNILNDNLAPLEAMLNIRQKMEKEGSIPKFTNQLKYKSHYNTEFQKGKMAMHINGTWHIEQLLHAKKEGRISFPWDIGPVPHVQNGDSYTTMGNVSILMMNDKSNDKEIAWQLLKYICGPEGAKHIAKQKVLPAFMSESVQNIYLGDTEPSPKNLRLITELNVRLELPADSNSPSLLKNVIGPNIDSALLGLTTPKDAIKKILKEKGKIAN